LGARAAGQLGREAARAAVVRDADNRRALADYSADDREPYLHIFFSHTSHFNIEKADPLCLEQLRMRVVSALVFLIYRKI
jgi:hypothetical protein